MYPHVGCRLTIRGPARPRGGGSHVARALACAASTSPPSRLGMPQHVCSGRTTLQPLCSSTRTARRRDPREIVVGQARRKERDGAARSRLGQRLVVLQPAGKGWSRQRGGGEAGRDARDRGHGLAHEAVGVDEVRDARHRPRRHPAEQLGLAQHPVLHRHAVSLGALGLLAQQEARDVERPLVRVFLRVGALHVAKLALPAQLGGARERRVVKHLGAGRPALLDVAVDAREHVRERAAIADAHAAAVADLERPPHLALEIAGVPVSRLVRVDGRGLLGDEVDLGHGPAGESTKGRSRQRRRGAGVRGFADVTLISS